MNKLKTICTGRTRPLLLCLFAGLLSSVPYYAEDLFVCTFLGYILLFFVIHNRFCNGNGIFVPFLCYFMAFFTMLYLFLGELYPFERFGFSPTQGVFVVICACILIPLLHAAVESCIMLLSRFSPSGIAEAIVFPALFVLGEWVLTIGTLAFPWGTTAVALTGFLPFVQVASLFGQYSVAFSVTCICYLTVLGLCESKKTLCLVGAGLFVLHSAIGCFLYFFPKADTSSAKAALIQGNVSSNEKWDSDEKQNIFQTYISMTEEAAKNGAELIVLPESSIPSTFYPNGTVHKALAEITKKYHTTVVAGVIAVDDNDDYHNAVIAVYPDGSLSEIYSKRHLVPFGEFVPFADTLGKLFPFLADFDESGISFTQGEKNVLIQSEHGIMGSMVCFDSIFPSFARANAKEGANMQIIVTNDSWFYDSQGVYTHLRHGRLRAIETGKPVLRAANTGISAVIDKKGNMISSSDALKCDIVYADFSPNDEKTLYTLWGDIILYISAGIILTMIIQYYIRRIKNGKDQTLRNRDV